MNLGLCIANLLKRYPAVDVPGIGVFKKVHTPASYDGGQSAFLPPESHIELVEGYANVFPITTYLQAQQQVDGPTAVAMLEAAVKEVMESISRNGEALLDGLGYLLADGASFVYQPFETDGFGRKPADARPPVISEQVMSDGADREAIESAGSEVAAVADEYVGKRRRPWMIAAAVVLAVLVALGALWYVQPTWFSGTAIAGFIERTGGERQQGGSQDPSTEVTPLVGGEVDSVFADTSRVAALVTDSIPDDADSVSAANTVAAKPSVTYEIIVGSFATMRQANKFVAEMKAKGYELQAIESRMPGNRKKISWGSFATEEEAYRELARVQKTFEPGAWIAKIAHE